MGFRILNVTILLEQNLNGHTFGVYSLVKLNYNKIASGSSDNSIKLWDLIKGICLKTLNGHSNYVQCILKRIYNRFALSHILDDTHRRKFDKRKVKCETVSLKSVLESSLIK